jgi:hypothetical protein
MAPVSRFRKNQTKNRRIIVRGVFVQIFNLINRVGPRLGTVKLNLDGLGSSPAGAVYLSSFSKGLSCKTALSSELWTLMCPL